MPRQPRRLIIPRSVPDTARRMIEGLWQHWPLDETARAALIRLATYPAMHTDVWEKLPGEPESAAGDVIRCAVIGLMAFPMLRPFPKTGRRAARDRWVEYRRKHPPPPPYDSHAYNALELLKAVCGIDDVSWAQHWQDLNHEHVISIFAAAVQSFLSMAEEREAWLTASRFPEVRKWDDPQALERFFSEWMSDQMQKIYGRDYDSVVAALTAVAFDREDVGAETVRWRRRTDRRKRRPTDRRK